MTGDGDKEKLKELEKRISELKKPEDNEIPEESLSPMRIGTELTAGILVGVIVGYWLDRWLGTKPIFFIICFFLGVAAGALNIYKLAAGKNNHK